MEENTQPPISNDKAAFWVKTYEDWKASGEGQREFCLKRNISYTQFGYWRSKLKKEKQSLTALPSHFIPVKIRPNSLGSNDEQTLKIALPSNILLSVPPHLSSTQLELIVKLTGGQW